jgi:hypothetical protein
LEIILLPIPYVKQLCLFNQVYSMIPSLKIIRVFMWDCNRWNRVRSERRGGEREREREQGINRVRDRVLDRNGNGSGWKRLLVKMDTWLFLVKQINGQIDCQSNWVGLKSHSFTGAAIFILIGTITLRLLVLYSNNSFSS